MLATRESHLNSDYRTAGALQGFPGGAVVKNPPAMQKLETQVRSLGREDPLEEEMATHCTVPCLENPMDRGAWAVHRVAGSDTTQYARMGVIMATGQGEEANRWETTEMNLVEFEG